MGEVVMYLTLGLFLSIIDTVVGTLLGFYFFKKVMMWGMQEGYRKSQNMSPSSPELTPVMAKTLLEEYDQTPNLPYPGQVIFAPAQDRRNPGGPANDET